MTTYEEWRVTGIRCGLPYETVWSKRSFKDPEAEARRDIESHRLAGLAWTDGPHLHWRTVTVTDWQEVEV